MGAFCCFLFMFLIAVLICLFQGPNSSWRCHSSNLLLLSTFWRQRHLAAVTDAVTCPVCPLCRKPPKPPKRPHCHLTRFLSWLCVRCAQPRLNLLAVADWCRHKKTTQTKPFLNQHLEEKPTTTKKWKTKYCQSKTGWRHDEIPIEKFPLTYTKPMTLEKVTIIRVS